MYIVYEGRFIELYKVSKSKIRLAVEIVKCGRATHLWVECLRNVILENITYLPFQLADLRCNPEQMNISSSIYHGVLLV
jgi:hypothetical protein